MEFAFALALAMLFALEFALALALSLAFVFAVARIIFSSFICMCANCHRDPRQFFVYVLIHHLLVIFVHILSYQLLSLSLLRSRGNHFL